MIVSHTSSFISEVSCSPMSCPMNRHMMGRSDLSKAYTRLRMFPGTISAKMGLLQAGAAQHFSSPHVTSTKAYKKKAPAPACKGKACKHRVYDEKA